MPDRILLTLRYFWMKSNLETDHNSEKNMKESSQEVRFDQDIEDWNVSPCNFILN